MEPIYVYQKGKGWVLGPSYPTLEVTTSDGHRVRLELRKPEKGEYYDITSSSNKYLYEPDLQEWGRLWMRFNLNCMQPLLESVGGSWDNPIWVTAVLLDPTP